MSLLLALLVPAVHAAPDPTLIYEYRGPTGEGEKTAGEIVELVRALPREEHLVKGPGAEDWTPWNQVPQLAEVLLLSPGAGGQAPPQRPPRDPAADPAPVPPSSGDPDADALVEPPTPAEPADAAPDPDARPAGGRDGTARGGGAVPVPPPIGTVHVGGDVRIDFLAENLERFAGGGEAPAAGFVISRARPIVDVTLGKWLYGRLAVEVRQDDTTTTYEDTGLSIDVRNWADGWSIMGREIWLGVHAGTTLRHDLRVGLLEPAFGVRDTYEERYPFAGEARADFARRTGLIPAEDLGIGWRGELGETWAFDLQVLNGSGTRVDQNSGKDFVARAAVTPGDLVSVSVSGLFGARAEDASGQQAQGEIAAEVHGPNQRLLVEGLIGVTTEDRLDTFYSGLAANGAWDFLLKGGEARVLDKITVVGRVYYYDPVAGWEAPDGWWAYAAGGWAGWNVAPLSAQNPRQVVRTGVTWEMTVPQDLAVDVTHDVVVEAAWRF